MINTLISILIEKGILDQIEGEELAAKIGLATLPADFKIAQAQVRKFIADIAKNK